MPWPHLAIWPGEDEPADHNIDAPRNGRSVTDGTFVSEVNKGAIELRHGFFVARRTARALDAAEVETKAIARHRRGAHVAIRSPIGRRGPALDWNVSGERWYPTRMLTAPATAKSSFIEQL